MPHYLILTKATKRGGKIVRENPERVEEINREVERIVQGVKVQQQCFLLAPHDFANVIMPATHMEDFSTFLKAKDKVSHIRELNPYLALDKPE